MKNTLIQKAKELKIEYIGFCSAKRDDVLFEILSKRREKFGINPFEEEDIEKRVDASLLLKTAKSIIVCLFPYKTKEETVKNLALYASVTDYHLVAQEKLALLAEVLSGFKTLCFADTGALCDRFLAFRAGLGFFGKNNMLINEKYGSYFAIGYILTDAEIEPDKELNKKCMGCCECIKNCPTNAIKEDFGFDYTKCLSFITQAKELSCEQKELLKKSDKIIGCDICQSVCPHNLTAQITPIDEFYKNNLSGISYDDISSLSNREFKEKFGSFAFSFLGKKRILRNITEKNK